MLAAMPDPAGTDATGVESALARTPPFDALVAEGRRALVTSARLVTYAAHSAVLIEDGEPARGMWLLLEGSVELLHDGQLVLVLEPGECFGHPSLLTGMAPAYTVRTRGTVRCIWLEPGAARAALGTPAGAAYVAASLRSRLVHQGHTASAAMDVGTTPVSAIMRTAAFIAPDTPLRDALAQLSGAASGVLLLGTDTATRGMLSDADVRRAAADGTLDLDAPAHTIAQPTVVSIPVGQLAVEAAVDMLAADVSAVAVTDGGRVLGLLSAAELVGLDAQSPIALRHMILGAADEDGLVRSAAHLPQLFVLLQRAGVPPRDLARVLSLQHDALVARLIDLSFSRHGAPAVVLGMPIAWCWLDLGSAARREFTLGSDQDNALGYGDPPAGRESAVDEYFARLATEVSAGLVRCGFGADENGVQAARALWRMSKSGWLGTFDACLTDPNESLLIRASVAFDFRGAAGDLSLTSELNGRIGTARSHPDFMRLMARVAARTPVALNRRGRLQTGHFDEPAGGLDLKRGAILPLVNLVRYHALAAGVTISPTLDRIAAAASSGSLDADTAAALREAFELITTLRFSCHANQVQAGLAPDNLITPADLAPIARGDLEEALRTVRNAQRRIDVLGGVY
jgi:CBS domain-containing protein